MQSGTPTRALSVSILTASVRGAICLNDVSSRAGNVGSARLCGPDNEKLSLAVQHALGEWLPTPPAEQLVEASPCPLPTTPQPMPQFAFLLEESEAESSTVASTSPSDSSEFEPDEEEAVSSSGATDVPTRAHTQAQVCAKRKRKGKGKVAGGLQIFGCRNAQAVKAGVSKICPRGEAGIEEDPEALESWLRGIKQ